MILSINDLARECQSETQQLRANQPDALTPKQKRSEACKRSARTRWANPEYRKLVRSMRTGKKCPKQGETMAKRWADPEYKRTLVSRMKASPKVMENMAKARAARMAKIAERKSK